MYQTQHASCYIQDISKNTKTLSRQYDEVSLDPPVPAYRIVATAKLDWRHSGVTSLSSLSRRKHVN